MQREIEWEWQNGYSRHNNRGVRLRDELLAIAELVENHRDEFDAHIGATEGRRAWLDRKAANAAAKPKGPPSVFGRP